MNPAMRFSGELNDLITVAITYSILYFILTYATAKLKAGYDKLYRSLEASHKELHQKADEIAAQNEELMQTQDSLNEVNSQLERIIGDRTAKIQAQNEILLKYSYTNAHHLRGPVARLLGLANIYRLDNQMDVNFIISKMEEQANEIDSVVKKINTELESENGTASTDSNVSNKVEKLNGSSYL
jgi:signal transduction histidine kinase